MGIVTSTSSLHSSSTSPSLPGTFDSPIRSPAQLAPHKTEPRLDIRSGFLPRTPPLCRIQLEPWSKWEEALDQARGLQPGFGELRDSHSATWRQYIRHQLPLLPTEGLSENLPLLRRAHLVLAFLVHFYVHSDQAPQNLDSTSHQPAFVPPALALPFSSVSQLLDIAPVLTYSDTVLFNWSLLDPANGFTLNNIQILNTFTGSVDEEHFYKTSVLIESLGPMCLSLMRSSLDEALLADQLSVARISSNLTLLASMIDQITLVLERVRDACDPARFYWLIRPWMNGGPRQMGPDGPVVNWGGPSAGQSTLIHTLDVFLGVDHRTRGLEPSHEATFMQRMTSYMPHHHRHFLNHLARTLAPDSQPAIFPQLPNHSTHSVRSLAIAAPPDSALFLAYNQAVQALLKMRGTHSRIALLYVLSQSRVPPPDGSPYLPSWKHSREVKKNELGTGGTHLALFLKRCRERTSEAILPEVP